MKIFRWKAIVLALCCAGASLAQAQQAGVIGSWRLVRIDSQNPDGKPSAASQPTGLLIYTREGHASVQLMYPQTSLSNEFVHDGYEATFGIYEVDEVKHRLTYHVQGSATREKLVGKSETLVYWDCRLGSIVVHGLLPRCSSSIRCVLELELVPFRSFGLLIPLGLLTKTAECREPSPFDTVPATKFGCPISRGGTGFKRPFLHSWAGEAGGRLKMDQSFVPGNAFSSTADQGGFQ